MRHDCMQGALLLVGGALILGVVGVEAKDQTEESAGRPLTMTVVSGGTNPASAGAEQRSGAQLVSMDFQDASLKDVLKIFSQQTGINVITSRDIGDRTITLYFEDVEAFDALDQILASASLAYERSPGSEIYIVKSQPAAPASAQTGLITKIFHLKYARASSSQLAKAVEAFAAITPFEAMQQT